VVSTRYSVVAGILVIVNVISLKLINKILPKVLGAVTVYDLLVLVVVAYQASRIGSAYLIDLLKSRL
jgi:hypothetical protein